VCWSVVKRGTHLQRFRFLSRPPGCVLGGEESLFEVASDIIEDAFGLRNLGVRGRTHGLEAHAFETTDRFFEWKPILKGQTEGTAEPLHQPAEGGSFFGHLDEDLSRSTVLEEAEGEVSLVSHDPELMGYGVTGRGENLTLSNHTGALRGGGSRPSEPSRYKPPRHSFGRFLSVAALATLQNWSAQQGQGTLTRSSRLISIRGPQRRRSSNSVAGSTVIGATFRGDAPLSIRTACS